MMRYDFTQILTLGSIQCALITALLYMLPLQKREKFPLRFLLCTLTVLLLAPLLKLYQTHTAALFRVGAPLRRFFGTLLCAGGGLSLNLLLICLVVFLCCKIKLHKALYCSVCAYLTQDIAYTVFVILMPDAAHRGAHSVQPDTLWLEILIIILVYGFFYLFFARKLPQNGDYQFNCAQSLPAMLLVMHIGRILGTYAKRSYDTQGNSVFIFMLIYDVLLSTTLLVTQLIQRREEEYRTAAALEAQLRLTQKKQYETFRENLDAINHKCHDLKHLAAALQSETDSARKTELLQELEQDVMIYDTHMNTGDDVLDALLSEAWMNCYHKNVQWTCMADGNAVRFLDPIDLYTMLGNALENAIESASQVSDPQKRFLCVNIWRKERMAFLKIENYCETVPKIRAGLPITSKKTPSEHGYGMRSIQAVVDRYSGELKIDVTNHIFTLNAIFSIPMDI